jgi:hypothetical protein
MTSPGRSPSFGASWSASTPANSRSGAPSEDNASHAREAAASDLGGDPKFSGWKPRLGTQIKLKPDGRAFLIPTKRSAGPWTVAEKGRHAEGGVGLFQGPALNLRTGRTSRNRTGDLVVRSRRQRKVSRWNGRTAGKNTATDARQRMEREIPDDVERVFKRQIGRHFDVS